MNFKFEKNVAWFVLLSIWCFNSTWSAKVLFIGSPMYSHFRSFGFVSDVLVSKGHDLWMVTTSKLDDQLKLKERGVKSIHFTNESRIEEYVDLIVTASIEDYLSTGKHQLDLEPIIQLEHHILSDEPLLSRIKKENFDLVVLDNSPISYMLAIIPYKFDIPFILYGPFYDVISHRIPFSPAVIASPLLAATERMNFKERFQNTLLHLTMLLFYPFAMGNEAATFAPEKPNIHLQAIISKSEFVILEFNIMLHFPIPLLPNIVSIGDVTPKSSLVIPSNLKKFLDTSKKGVVLVSFGSLATIDDKPVFQKLLSAFKRTKYNYIIKGEFSQSDDQILFENWIPQSALLKHVNIKLFITHCGANGIREAIMNGVPMLGFPLFAEQPGNAFKIQARGFGIKMDLYWDNEDDIVKSINEIIENPEFKNTVKRASEFMNAQKGNATLEAVFWIETILKFGGEYLRSAGVDLPLYQYLLLDVILVLSCIIIGAIVIMYLICKCFCNRMCPKTKTKRE